MSRSVAAVIVAYGSNFELPGCLASLRGRVGQTVVVDNFPDCPVPARLRARHPEVVWIDNPVNRGFAGAVNQGVAATTAPFVLLLNPDCELLAGVGSLVDLCQRDRVAGAGGLLLCADGSPQTGFFCRSLPTPQALALEALGVNRLWPSNRVNRRLRMLDMDPSAGCEVEQPAGAFLMLRRDALEELGGLDEGFHPLWFEDADLCRRLRDAGYALRYSPGAKATHAGAHSVRELSLQARLEAWYGGLLRYAEKHFSHGAYRRVRIAVLVGLLLRKVYCLGRGGGSGEAEAYGAMFRLVRRGFALGAKTS